MIFKELITSLMGYCCFECNETLSLVGNNSDLSAVSGYSPAEFEDKFNNQLIGLIFPVDRPELFKSLHTQLKHSDFVEALFRIRHKNGHIVWILAKIRKLTNPDMSEYLCAAFTDCTKYKTQQDHADKLMHQYQIILSQTQNVTFELDVPTDTITFSDTWMNLFDYIPETRNFIATLPAKAHIYSADIPQLLQCLKAMKKGASYQTLDLRLSTGKKFVWFCLRATAMYDDDGNLLKIIGILLNIDESKRAASVLQNQAEQDSLTKLLNKQTCKREIETYLNSLPDGAYCAMILIDLDNFKKVNDRYGHLYGDQVLLKAAQSIKTIFRERDIVARFGGDEFMVLMKGVSNEELVRDRCQKMLESFHTLLENDEIRQTTSFSIGVSLSPQHATSYESLFECADKAMYEAKKLGKNTFFIYE